MTIERRRLNLTDKLEIMTRQARCPKCGEKLGKIANVEFDHNQALARGGSDANDNIVALHVDCHATKTFGTGATTHGSDAQEIARDKRLTKTQQEFRARLLAKGAGEPKPKSKWGSRPFGRKPRPVERREDA